MTVGLLLGASLTACQSSADDTDAGTPSPSGSGSSAASASPSPSVTPTVAPPALSTPFDGSPQWFSEDITSDIQAVGTESGVAVLVPSALRADEAALLHIPNTLTGAVVLDESDRTDGVVVLAEAVPSGVEHSLSVTGDGSVVVVAAADQKDQGRAAVTVQAYEVASATELWSSPVKVEPNEVPLTLDASSGLIRVKGHVFTVEGQDLSAGVDVDDNTYDLPVTAERLLRQDGFQFVFDVLAVPSEKKVWEAEQVSFPEVCGLSSGAELVDARAGVVLVKCANSVGTLLVFDGEDGATIAFPGKRHAVGANGTPTVDARASGQHAVVAVGDVLLGFEETASGATRMLWMDNDPAAPLQSAVLSGSRLFTTAEVVDVTSGEASLQAEAGGYSTPLAASTGGGLVLFADDDGGAAYDIATLPTQP